MLVPSTIVHVFVGMPRIDGGHTIGDSILARTLRNLDEGSIRIHRTRFDPLDRVTNTIPNVVRAVLVAGIGRFGHQNSNVPRGNCAVRQFQRNGATLTVLHSARWKHLPFALRSAVKVQCIRTTPILDLVSRSKRAGPGDAHGVHRLFSWHVHDDPLRMQSIALAGELAGQVGIALPIAEIRTLDWTITAGGKSPMR